MKKVMFIMFKKATATLIIASLCLMAVSFSGCSILEDIMPSENCTVVYSGNGNTTGTAPQDATTYSSGTTVTVLDNTGDLERDDLYFNGWNSAADGNGTDYLVGSTFVITSNKLLYAKWVTENELPRYASLKKVNIKPIEIDAPSQSVSPIMNVGYWNSVKLDEFSMTFGEYSLELPKYTFKEGFEFEQGTTIYTIDDVTFIDLPLNEYTSFNVNSNANYFKRLLSTYNTLTFRSSFFIENFAKPEYTNPLVVTSVGAVGGSTVPYFESIDYPVEDGVTQITVEFNDCVLTACGFTNYSVQFVFDITRGDLPIEQLYNVTYDGNGTTENLPLDSINYYSGSTATVKDKGTMSLTNNMFTGWNTQADGTGIEYAEDDTIIMIEDVTLYAQWSNLATASIMGKSIKDIEINSNTYSSTSTTYLDQNYEYGMATYLYVDVLSHPTLSISDFVSIVVNPSTANVTYEYLNDSSSIGFDEEFNVPTTTSAQVTIQIKVMQGTEILDAL